MNSTPDTPPQPTPAPASEPAPAPGPKRFERSSAERIIGGVCGGLGRYFGIDATLVRIGMVALALLGGTGLIVYAAALVLVPADGKVAPGPRDTRDRALAVGLAIVLAIVCLVGGLGLGLGPGLGGLFPLALLCVAGLAVWWFVSGERPAGTPRTIAYRAALGATLLVGCFALSVGSFLASGLGGGVVVASIVIAAGAALVAAAFVGGARWLVLPALAIALPLAFVSATGIDLDGGVGERHVRPGTLAEVKQGYRLGLGELVIDLRDVELPAGDHHVEVGIGMGHALVLVPDDICIASTAKVGMGGVAVFERDGGGIDVAWSDGRRAPAGTPRLIIDGDVGVGLFEVRHRRRDHEERRGLADPERAGDDERNSACATRVARRDRGASRG